MFDVYPGHAKPIPVHLRLICAVREGQPVTIPFNGDRDEREDMKAYWEKIARAFGLSIVATMSHATLSLPEDA